MFTQRVEELFNAFGKHQVMCLATSANDRVTARSMSFIITDVKFYFQTDKCFLKYKQIAANPQIAICFQNVQIEGVCKNLGHPLLESNCFFADLYQQYYIPSFEKYTPLDNETLFEVAPVFISTWDYENGKPFQELFNFEEQTYRKEYYNG